MMARYWVTLWLESNPECRVTQVIKRSDQCRAISYAEGWLARSRLSTRIVGLYYDKWTVQAIGDDNLPRIIATGGVQVGEAEGVLREPANGRTGRVSKSRAGGSGGKTAKGIKDRGSADWGNKSAYPEKGRKVREVMPQKSALRGRIAQMVNQAKQKKVDSDSISSLGSD